MIQIKYHGRFGNQIFQYCYGRILAENYNLHLLPYNGQYSHLIESETYNGRIITNPTITINDNSIDYFEYFGNCGYIIDGYFQQWLLYYPWKENIKHWLTFPKTDFKPNTNDIAIHIRRSDFGWPQNSGMLPLSFYTDILESSTFDKLYIFGGCSHNNEQSDFDLKVIETFAKYNPIYFGISAIDDFINIQKFRRVIQSMSTFCWWSSFLSDVSEEIYTPITIGGYWDKENPLVNLRVNETRYKYIKDVKVEKW